MRQVQAFAVTNDEKDKDEEDEKEEKKQVEPGQPAAQWGPECSISRNLEDIGEDDAQRRASFCTRLFPSTLFFACSHICCLVVCFLPDLLFQKHTVVCTNVIVLCVKGYKFGLVCLVETQVCWLFRVMCHWAVCTDCEKDYCYNLEKIFPWMVLPNQQMFFSLTKISNIIPNIQLPRFLTKI